MTLKDLFRKKDKIGENITPSVGPPEGPEASQFTFMRTDTNTQELIRPPTFYDEASPSRNEDHGLTQHMSRLRSTSNASTASKSSCQGEKRRSYRLHLRSGSRTSSRSSVHVPTDLPEIQDVAVQGEEKEAAWEERATILAKRNVNPTQDGHSQPSTAVDHSEDQAHLGSRPSARRSISDANADENIQEAIRLHESGDLKSSTAMFGRLASHNAMAQILYGLALRHGWGIDADPARGLTYLSQAASNSAAVESEALAAGLRKGGAAKGELVLAIYELANSFRHGWGVERDMVAARKYYETAANLGDTDAINEVARCYEEGLGGKKDKVSSIHFVCVTGCLLVDSGAFGRGEEDTLSSPQRHPAWKDPELQRPTLLLSAPLEIRHTSRCNRPSNP